MRCFKSWMLLAVPLLLGTASLQAQDGFESDDPKLEIRVYRVGDSLLPPKNYPFPAHGLPTVAEPGQAASGGYSPFAGLGGGGLGGGGGGGGGFFNLQDQTRNGSRVPVHAQFGGDMGGGMGGMGLGMQPDSAAQAAFSLEDLKHVIMNSIAPESWSQMGGEANIETLGGLLIVSQTPEIHERLAALLDMIRLEGGSRKTITLQANWVLATSQDLQRMRGDQTGSPVVVDRDVLNQLVSGQPGFQGAITCFDGQTVHIASGHRRTVVVSSIPVVGGTDSAHMQSSVTPNFGVLLQSNVTLSPDESAAVLDLRSAVTFSGEGDQMGVEGQVDRVNMPAQTLFTTCRVPLNQPVLVGGMSFVSDQMPDGTTEAPQIYLVVEITAEK